MTWAVPHRFIEYDHDRFVLYRAPGSQCRWMGTDDDESSYLERIARGDESREFTWSETHVLHLVRQGDPFAVEVFWDESWSLLGWYVNLQAPMRSSGLGYDTFDWALDVDVDPDGTWRWKDEAHLAEAVRLGIFDGSEAAEIRAAGEQAIAEQPWPTGWEDWRPPEEWTPLPLPEGWDK